MLREAKANVDFDIGKYVDKNSSGLLEMLDIRDKLKRALGSSTDLRTLNWTAVGSCAMLSLRQTRGKRVPTSAPTRSRNWRHLYQRVAKHGKMRANVRKHGRIVRRLKKLKRLNEQFKDCIKRANTL